MIGVLGHDSELLRLYWANNPIVQYSKLPQLSISIGHLYLLLQWSSYPHLYCILTRPHFLCISGLSKKREDVFVWWDTRLVGVDSAFLQERKSQNRKFLLTEDDIVILLRWESCNSAGRLGKLSLKNYSVLYTHTVTANLLDQ